MVREILHAQTLKIRAEVLSHYIKTAKVRLGIGGGVVGFTMMKVLYLSWSVQKYTLGKYLTDT